MVNSATSCKYKVTLYTTLIMWKSLAFNAFKHLLVFCQFENTILEPLAKAQETWARALLGWNANLPGPAAISDLGWLHITKELMMLRAAFYIRLKDLPAGPAYTRIKDIMAAAERIRSSWSHQTMIMLRSVITPLSTPAGNTAWRSVLPQATRNIKLINETLLQASLVSTPNISLYPKHRLTPHHHHLLYKLQLDFAKSNFFGTLRAGASIFAQPLSKCPACGDNECDTTHILRKCISTRTCLNTWLMNISPPNGEWRTGMTERAFTESIFDLHSFPTRADRITTVTFVYEAVTAARKIAISRRDAHQMDTPTG